MLKRYSQILACTSSRCSSRIINLRNIQEYTEGLLDHVTVLVGIAFGSEAVAGVIHQPFFNYKSTGNRSRYEGPIYNSLISAEDGKIWGSQYLFSRKISALISDLFFLSKGNLSSRISFCYKIWPSESNLNHLRWKILSNLTIQGSYTKPNWKTESFCRE